MNLHIIILAAGLGKRMYSQTPKVLHLLAGKPLLRHVVETAQKLEPRAIHVIHGHGGEQLQQSLTDLPIHWVHQTEQLGTGHAVLQAIPSIPKDALVLVLSADVPLIGAETLQALVAASLTQNRANLALLVAHLEDPYGLGRIIRNAKGDITCIVEEKDASPQQRAIAEIYTGICCTTAECLWQWLPLLNKNNSQQEYYLTEIIAHALSQGVPITSIKAQNAMEIQGVNNRLQLAQLERTWQKQQAEALLMAGTSLADPSRFDLRGELHCGKDVFIDINCVFIGKVSLGDGCRIGPNCYLSNVTIAEGTIIQANTVIDGCDIGPHCTIGPFAHLRPGTQLDAFCKIGNFVETKKAHFGANSKASHLSYLGDVTLGKSVNIGAGTITCNYDGVNKYQTVIEDEAFIGSDTQLIAPVTIGAKATIAAGSTIRKDAPPNALTLTESKQKTILGWKRQDKK